MKLPLQCCSLDQAKMLKELGVEQNSLFNFSGDAEDELEIVYTDGYNWSDHPGYSGCKIHYSAFTVAELGVMLPLYISDSRGVDFIQATSKQLYYFDNSKEAYNVGFYNFGIRSWFYHEMDELTIADGMAKVLIRLMQDDKITVQEVNERLLK